jgi:hypothetical protein
MPLLMPDGQPYRYSWTGGFNYCQPGMLDLDQDGINDLVLFDRSGDRILPFVYLGPNGSLNYRHDYRFVDDFPEIKDFLVLYDFDCDGRNDLFTYADGGIKVYRNISGAAQGLKFELYTPALTSDLISVFILPVDYPGVADTDNDGDTDLLVFSFSGTCIEFHRNMAKELFNRCDTFALRYESDNWGVFTEDLSSNTITLNDSCDKPGGRLGELRHAGSSLLVIDLDGDKDKDLILGDITYPNLLELRNGGSLQKAKITMQVQGFPANSRSVNLPVFPVAGLADLDHDGKSDLLVGANSKSNAENYRSVWYYKNTGTTDIPSFSFVTDTLMVALSPDFGQGSIPVLFDYNNDGKQDLVIGNEGYSGSGGLQPALALFENTGDAFRLVTRDFAGLSTLQTGVRYFHPAFTDLDTDGDKDMLIGCSDGKLLQFENTAGSAAEASFEFRTASFGQIDVGTFAAPFAFDLDGDNQDELICGNGEGKFWYFKLKPQGALIIPELISNFWGGVTTADQQSPQGFSRPFLFRKNAENYLLSGSASGNFKLFSIDENGLLMLADSTLGGRQPGEKTAVCLSDFNNDGLLDAISGNQAGGLCYYQGMPPLDLKTIAAPSPLLHLFPNPGHDHLTILPVCNVDVNGSVTVYDLCGKEISSGRLAADGLKINTANWATGVYVCRYALHNRITFIKWIKY